MKVLLAIDGSPHSEVATDAVANRPWPNDTMIKILTIVHPTVPVLPDPAFVIAAIHEEQSLALWHSASALLEKAASEVGRNTGVTVITKILEGSPKHLIVEEAKGWGQT